MTARIFSFRSYFDSFNRSIAALLAATALTGTGCATNRPPDVGSRVWHEQRMGEIEAAYEHGDLTVDQYLSLKNEADATRAEYQSSLRRNTTVVYTSPFFFHHHH